MRLGRLIALSTALAALAAPTLARADSASTLTVIGTSDVSDSGLMANLIQPMFAAAYPQYTFKYIGTATGTAIANAEAGSQGASVLIVHAASLENQFVAGGYSYEPYGRAIFTNDFVLAGPNGDPAGVAANAGHDIVQAFADVATAGTNGGGTPTATFVSRGGTPGTTVEEHQIWALVAGMAKPPAGLLLCAVSAANGGGDTPIAPFQGVTQSGQQCPNSGALPSGGQLPSWYVATGLTQGPNVVAANACNGYRSGANSCYVLTDRGTYDYLASGSDPAGTIPNLAILTRNNSATATGGASLLVNYFHAYIINPAKPNEQINLPAAQAFMNLLTSPGLQSQLKVYLDDTTDPGGPPFVADASPLLTASGITGTVAAGTTVKVTGSLVNAEPFYPPPASQTVTLSQIVGGLALPVATATTDAAGNYAIGFVPTTSGSYQVSTGQISQIENSTLSPVFGDLLSPAATAPVALTVQAAISIAAVNTATGGFTVAGTVAPGALDANARVTILARPAGSTAAFTEVASAPLTAGQTNYLIGGSLAPGAWQIEASYADPGEFAAATTGPVSVTMPAPLAQSSSKPSPPPAVLFTKITVRRGKLTVTGRLRPAPTAKGAVVELFAARGEALGHARSSAGITPGRFASARVAIGRTKFTLHAKLRRGYLWVLQLEYLRRGTASIFSRLSAVDVR